MLESTKQTENSSKNGNKSKPMLADSAFVRGKIKLPKGKFKNVYSYQMLDGTIRHQAYITKYKWSCYFNTEKEAAIAVDKFLINKGLKPINVLRSV